MTVLSIFEISSMHQVPHQSVPDFEAVSVLMSNLFIARDSGDKYWVPEVFAID